MPTTTLTLQVQNGTDALQRIVSTCRRRDVEIIALSYSEAEITLTLSGRPRQVRRIDRWLAALVNVLDVQPDVLPWPSGATSSALLSGEPR